MNKTPGEHIELRYALNAFGIPSDDLPVTWKGKIKLNYHKQWMKLRTCIESKPDYYLNGENTVSKSNPIVECPNSTDVIFRRGMSTSTHPGNARFRSFIQNKYEEYINIRYDNDGNDKLLLHPPSTHTATKTKTTTTTTTLHTTTKQLILILIKETIQNSHSDDCGRFLIWKVLNKDDEYGRNGLTGYWTEVTDEKQIYSKIEFMVNRFKYSKRSYSLINDNSSGRLSSIGNSSVSGNKRVMKENKRVTNRVKTDIIDQDHRVATYLLQDDSKVTTTTPTILQSDTSIFQSLYEENRQYGTIKEETKDINSKRLDSYTIATNTTASCPGQCFGKPFFCVQDENLFVIK